MLLLLLKNLYNLINLNKIEKLFFAVTRAIEIIGELSRIFLNPRSKQYPDVSWRAIAAR